MVKFEILKFLFIRYSHFFSDILSKIQRLHLVVFYNVVKPFLLDCIRQTFCSAVYDTVYLEGIGGTSECPMGYEIEMDIEKCKTAMPLLPFDREDCWKGGSKTGFVGCFTNGSKSYYSNCAASKTKGSHRPICVLKRGIFIFFL